ncbi:hypothetical protein PRK78_007320 [Emydomyces testavorans]|uniref:Inhibitor I9 domain-containing protein n=1 Tax=Emydomyces testavorans TaxID=2070801 RepID=A0AAF0DN09_9EURO|nr:hypothetical protein PRK78_007320 [Emydomyces testavorans]
MGTGAPRRSVIVTFPDDTPASVVEAAKKAITDAGGSITHSYNLIKGFAAEATTSSLNTVAALGVGYPPMIEDDQIVSIDDPDN